MSDNVIKTIKTQDLNTTYRIGADAQDIDYNGNKNLTQIIGNQLTNEPLSERIETNENNISSLTSNLNYLTTQIANIIANNESMSDQIENLENVCSELNSNIQTITMPTLINKIIWDTANNRTLRAVLGPLENMPFNSVRDWLNSLESNSNSRELVWTSIRDELN